MKRHEIRQNRIRELTTRALKGQTLDQLLERCNQWKISQTTSNNYIEEVRERLTKAQKGR